VGHRKAFLVEEDYKLAWWEVEVCKQVSWEEAAYKLALLEVEVCMRALQVQVVCRKVQVELCKLAWLEGVGIQALQLLHKLALEGSQILDEVQGVQVHTQACLALACIVGELLAEEHSWVLGPEESSWVSGPEEHSWVSEQEEHSWALELSRMVLALEQNMLASALEHCMMAWVRCKKA